MVFLITKREIETENQIKKPNQWSRRHRLSFLRSHPFHAMGGESGPPPFAIRACFMKTR